MENEYVVGSKKDLLKNDLTWSLVIYMEWIYQHKEYDFGVKQTYFSGPGEAFTFYEP